MNSRQRRGVILLLLSVLCAVGAFVGVLSVIQNVESKVGPEKTAYRLKTDVAAYKALDPGQFEKVKMPERWLPPTAVTDLDQVSGRIAVTPLKKGSLLQDDMIVERPALKAGQQEIAIMIDAATGVAGKINPGARVNIYATFEGKRPEDKPVSKVIVSGAQVIDVGKLTPLEAKDPGDTTSTTTGRQAGDAVPITFALNTQDAQRVAYAESFASHVRLALLAPGSEATVPPGQRTYTLDGDK
ncbi:pilus assembly protein CpaB [Streptomyces sp. 2224.1]|uniref:Flp pilus assembly protein CpaB n=1 Tax=Streptomyces mooreae TaxID=3075523 RepID=A0ABU2TCC4_9ACTN|nr:MULTISPECIES: Flp pilus assembly protein CpaB [unclassified Streptomyces]MDT0458600.1 Flp pilus assembly protein CpaB [Streptomyces sp. DSM 41527]PBC84781.1 pilus assembly protein CpaB [Streptomyces sp. 2321.6]SDR26721.1 pilus assembly protein CpaB [Streptomyces sp. KS_16]SEB62273.1 pilus assembly protein CpaB [Streptomyces sp. 2224.1]SED44293.1 pilus assembly protein CpaB [Streptomyces sp. 2133.1]